MKTTDNQDELFYWVNEEDQVLGSITRRQAHSSSFKIHRGVWVLVYNNKGELFLQKRSLIKDSNPGMWSLSVGGHVTWGQSYKEAALREFQEELGVSPPITFLKKIHFVSSFEQEISCIYKAIHTGPFTLNPQEIEIGKFFTLSEIEKKVRSQEMEVSSWALVILQAIYGIIPERANIKKQLKKIF